MSSGRITGWHVTVFLLAVVAAVFHFWEGEPMRFASVIGNYFVVVGALFLLGGVLALVGGRGFIFKLGTAGVLALAVIDNGLLYYTRTYGMGFVFNLFPSPRPFGGKPFNGTYPAGGFNGTHFFNGTGTRVFNGTFTGRAFGRAVPWSTSWFPPGAVQFFVLQTVIIVIAVLAIWSVGRTSAAVSTAGTPVTGSAQTHPSETPFGIVQGLHPPETETLPSLLIPVHDRAG